MTNQDSVLTPVLTDMWDVERGWTLPAYEGKGGYQALDRAFGMSPGRRHRRRQGVRPARPWRCRLPDRHEVVLHPAGQPEAQVPRRQRRRVRAGDLQGHPADDGQPSRPRRGRDHQLLRDPRQQGVHLHPWRGAPRRPPGAGRRRRGVRRRPPRQGHPRLRLRPRRRRPRRRGRLHLRRGNRAARGSRGSPRPAAAPAAVPGRRRALRQPDRHQQRRVDRLGAEHRRATARSGSRRWAPRSPRATASSPCPGTCRSRASTKLRSASRSASCSTWPAASARDTTSSSGRPAAPALRCSPPSTSTSRSTSRRSVRPARCSAPGRCRSSTTACASSAPCCAGRSSTSTSRAASALLAARAPGGWCRRSRAWSGARATRPTSTCCSTSATTSWAARSARSVTVRPARSRARSSTSATSTSPT